MDPQSYSYRWQYRDTLMAKKRGDRVLIRLKSSESPHMYHTEKNKRNDPDRLEVKRYDPILRRHVVYRETR
jgi:large subunit ribosomal protein L33